MDIKLKEEKKQNTNKMSESNIFASQKEDDQLFYIYTHKNQLRCFCFFNKKLKEYNINYN